jgi:hypothetical protein
MKRILLLLFILLSLSQARAYDTLTVRQVYNFNVGDTFDYVIENYAEYGTNTYGFYKIIITNKWHSISQDTLYYSRFILPSPQSFDTISFTNLDSLLPLNDTPQTCSGCTMNLTIDSACNTVRNSIGWGNGLYGVFYIYIEGLGKVQSGAGGDDNTGIDTALTAYVINGVYNQTPYFTTGINNISSPSNIKVYPNPSTDQLNLSITDVGMTKAQFIIADILGQEVYSSTITQSESKHDISRLSSGIYTWRIVEDQTTIKTRKVVKQ